MKGKRLVSILLTLTLAFGMVMQVQASSISETQKKGEELQSQKSAAEAEKKELTNQLNTLITEMDQTASDIEAKQDEIAEKEDELIQAQIDENNQYESMKKRIKYMYENGNTQFIEILLESKSIGDFLNNAEYIAQISEYDRNMLTEFQDTVKLVDKQKTALEDEKAELETLQTELQAKQDKLNTLLEEKADEISDLEVAIGENAAKLKALQEAAAEQARLQQEAVTPVTPTPAPQPPITPTPSGNGKLSNPCPSGWVSSYFGGRDSPGGIGSSNHKGQDFAASSGSPIYAAASGTVTTVSYNSARGNYVVVNHGGGLSTLYQHCSAIYVSAGQSVSCGQNIAAVGTTGISTGPHLHFEVWENSTPVDPRYYL
ncbi:MAG: peptidoglycan DD-metalloendopeptidase family protein [Eubacteriales bacterium]|nr:peptidoglycan DD-metalloendopeptidase family protein [Eubacteriales bacterium]